jgi:hypothetical protein
MIERSSHSESTRSGLAPVAAALIAGSSWPGHARREAIAGGAVPSATIIVAVCGAEVDGDAAPEPRLWLPPQRACAHGLGNEAAPSSLPSLHLAWAMPSPDTICWDPDDRPLWSCRAVSSAGSSADAARAKRGRPRPAPWSRHAATQLKMAIMNGVKIRDVPRMTWSLHAHLRLRLGRTTPRRR